MASQYQSGKESNLNRSLHQEKGHKLTQGERQKGGEHSSHKKGKEATGK